MKKNTFIFVVGLFVLASIVLLCKNYFTVNFCVDFDVSMQTACYPDVVNTPWSNQVMSIFRELYKKNNLCSVTQSKSLKIPKIIHQIWLGSEFPEKYKLFQQSWIKHHPDWEYKLWQEADIEKLPLHNRALYDAARNYGEKSDIARYEILYMFGGLYVDTDYECIKPCDIFHYSYDFYIGIQPLDTNSAQLGIGLIGAAPGHQLLNYAIKGLPASAQQTQQIVVKTGPFYFTRIFCLYARQVPGITIAFPATFFYPRGYNQSFEERVNWLKPESFAVHHWAGSWLTKEAFMK